MKVFPNVTDFTFKNAPHVALKDALSLLAKKYFAFFTYFEVKITAVPLDT
jgi:hypothetical protein